VSHQTACPTKLCLLLMQVAHKFMSISNCETSDDVTALSSVTFPLHLPKVLFLPLAFCPSSRAPKTPPLPFSTQLRFVGRCEQGGWGLPTAPTVAWLTACTQGSYGPMLSLMRVKSNTKVYSRHSLCQNWLRFSFT